MFSFLLSKNRIQSVFEVALMSGREVRVRELRVRVRELRVRVRVMGLMSWRGCSVIILYIGSHWMQYASRAQSLYATTKA